MNGGILLKPYDNYNESSEDVNGHRQLQQWGPIGGFFDFYGSPGRPPGLSPYTPPVPGPPGPPTQVGPPTTPPPAFVPPSPTADVGLFAVDPGAIRGCLYRFTYIWLVNRQQFWFYPVFVGRTSVSGYRWTGFFWVYFGIDLRQINSFQCF